MSDNAKQGVTRREFAASAMAGAALVAGAGPASAQAGNEPAKPGKAAIEVLEAMEAEIPVKSAYVAEGAVHVYHQYTIRLEGATGEERDRFVTALKEEHQVGSGVYYPIPNHRLPSLAPYAPGLELPNTEKVAAECVSLPVHPSLSQADRERIVAAVNTCAKAGA